MFINIKNGQLAKRDFVYCAQKKTSKFFLKILWKEGFINSYRISFKYPAKYKIFLKYNKNRSVLNSLKFISKPAQKIYYSINQLWKINNSKSLIIISTDQGLKTLEECKIQKIGGEPFIIIN